VALDLARRQPDAPGYVLATHQLALADVLRQLNAYAEAVELAEEVLAAPTSSRYALRWANRTLAYARLGLQEYPAALAAARECLALAQAMQSPQVLSSAYEVLGQVQRTMGQMAEAMQSAAQYWRWARREGSIEYAYFALDSCARVRLLQVRQASRLSLEEELPEHLPAEADRTQTVHLLASARRFVERARPLARRLDQANGTHTRQEGVDRLASEVEQLAALLRPEVG